MVVEILGHNVKWKSGLSVNNAVYIEQNQCDLQILLNECLKEVDAFGKREHSYGGIFFFFFLGKRVK